MKVLGALLLLLFIDSIFCGKNYFGLDKQFPNCTTLDEALNEMTKPYQQNPSTKKCFYNCVFEKSKMIANGKIVKEYFKEKLKKVKPCLSIEDSNRCELAFKLYECLAKL
ncbi:general odorant-binding protein 56a-like [Drosophila ficusphila]|uniref:general odorant-binding protein 56a-like n=1 Tax=Drosophila ficusphila TaxID=30025 RepID=UPI0007E7C815|nr:general odorant-binding protein 56a-like [Drosophila ficusphila]